MSNKLENTNQLILRIAAISALIGIALIPVQMFVFIKWPPPEQPLAFLELFNQQPLLGLLNLDLMYLFNNVLLVLFYFGFLIAFKSSKYYTYVLFSIVLGFIGLAIYFTTNVGFEVMTLSKQYFSTTDTQIQQQILAATTGMLATYKGTAFVVYYEFNAITLLTIAVVMLKETIFTKSTAVWGLISGFLMLVPSVFGMVGIVCSVLSLIPWIGFTILTAKRMLQLSHQYNLDQ